MTKRNAATEPLAWVRIDLSVPCPHCGVPYFCHPVNTIVTHGRAADRARGATEEDAGT